MKNLAKKLTVGAVAFAATGMLFAGAMAIKPATAMAEGEMFAMKPVAAARISSPSGLRFVAKMDETTKTSVAEGLASGGEFGFLIAPSSFFTTDVVDAKDYHNDLADYVTASFTSTDAEKFYEDDEGNWCANGAITNILQANFDLDFTAVAYHKLSGASAYTYADVDVNALSKNIQEIVSKAYLYEADKRQDLVDSFAIGTESKPVAVASAEDFGAMAMMENNTLNYALTEDITLAQDSNKALYTYNTDFTATLDGQNHTITNDVDYGTAEYGGIFKTISGTVKNVVIDTAIVAGEQNMRSIAIAENLDGKVENVAAITDFEGSAGYGFTRSLFLKLKANAVVTNLLRFDETATSPGVHIANTATNGAQVNNFSYIGVSYSDHTWQKAPKSEMTSAGSYVGTGNITLNGYYIYENIIKARAGEGKALTAFVDVNDVYNKDSNATYTAFADKALATTLSAPFAIEGKKVLMGSNVVYQPKTVNITSSAEFLAAVKAGGEDVLNLQTDVSLATTDGNTSGTYFGVNFIGTLNGNNHTVSIASAVNAGTTKVNPGLWGTISGDITNVKFDLDYSAWMQSGNVDYQGVIAEKMSGSLKHCIVDVDFGDIASRAIKFPSIVGWVQAGTLENIVYSGAFAGTNGTSGLQRVTSSMDAGSTVKDIVIISSYASSKYFLMPITTSGNDFAKNSTLSNINVFYRDGEGVISDGQQFNVATYTGQYLSYGEDWWNRSFNKTSCLTALGEVAPDTLVTGFVINGNSVTFA